MTITLTINAENGTDLQAQLEGLVRMQPKVLHFDNSGSGYIPPASEPTVVPAGMSSTPGGVAFVGIAKIKKRGRKAAIKEASNQADLAANPPAVQENAPAPAAAIARAEKAAVSVTPKADEPITAELCKALALEVSSKKGVQPARDIILSFGVARLSELKPEQYGDFVVKMKAKLAE